MKKKTIRRIMADIFAAVMVIMALPQMSGVSAYAKTALPVKDHKFVAEWRTVMPKEL